MSPTPSDARWARPECGHVEDSHIANWRGFGNVVCEECISGDPKQRMGDVTHAFVAPTRVDEAPPPTKWPRGTCQKNDKPHAKSDVCIDFVEVPTPEQPAVTGEPGFDASGNEVCCWHGHANCGGCCVAGVCDFHAVTTEPNTDAEFLHNMARYFWEKDAACTGILAKGVSAIQAARLERIAVKLAPETPRANGQENIGIPQTASRASRPAVESDGSASEVSPSWLPVEFRGMTLYVRRAFLDGIEGDSPVAPPEHITDGELNTLDGANSYAHVYRDGGILRYWKKIGEATDLKPLTPVSRTLGATDAPREDGTDVDPMVPFRGHDYPSAARSIALNLAEFCDESLPYPDMIAHAAINAAAALSSTRTALQRVREAESEVRWKSFRDGYLHGCSRAPGIREQDIALAEGHASEYTDVRRALTSTETDQ